MNLSLSLLPVGETPRRDPHGSRRRRRALRKRLRDRGRGSRPRPVAGREPLSRRSSYQPAAGVLPPAPVDFVDLVIMLPDVLTT